MQAYNSSEKWATKDRFEPRTKLQKTKIQKKNFNFVFEFCPRFKSVLGTLHFPLRRTLKNYFLNVKIILEFCPEKLLFICESIF